MLSKPKTFSGQSKSLKVWSGELVKNPTVGKKSQDEYYFKRIFRSGWQSLYLLLWPLLHKTCLNVGRNHSWLKFPQSPQAVQQSLLQPRTYGAFYTHTLYLLYGAMTSTLIASWQWATKVTYKLREGDTVVFDNLRVMHGRFGFISTIVLINHNHNSQKSQ